MKKSRRSRPGLWAATWYGVQFVDEGGNLTTRRGVVRVFTVAAGQEEAALTLHNGFLSHDDVEDPGTIRFFRRLRVPPRLVPETVARLEKSGARFIVPYDRLRVSDKGLLAYLLIVDAR